MTLFPKLSHRLFASVLVLESQIKKIQKKSFLGSTQVLKLKNMQKLAIFQKITYLTTLVAHFNLFPKHTIWRLR